MVLGSKRKALGEVSINNENEPLTRSEKLKQWKLGKQQKTEAASSQDVEKAVLQWKKKANHALNLNKQLEQKLKALSSVPKTEAAVQTMEDAKQKAQIEEIEQTRKEKIVLEERLQSTASQVRSAEKGAFESENYARTLKRTLSHAVRNNDKLENRIMELSEKASQLPIAHSHVIELQLLQRLTEYELEMKQQEDEAASRRRKAKRKRAKRIEVSSKMSFKGSVDRECIDTELEALRHQVQLSGVKAEAHSAHSAQLQFANELLLLQMAEVIEDEEQRVGDIRAEHEASQQDMNQFVESIQEQMSQGMTKSIAKIKELRKQVLQLTRENRALCEQVVQQRSHQTELEASKDEVA